jgi:hypothetical protein
LREALFLRTFSPSKYTHFSCFLLSCGFSSYARGSAQDDDSTYLSLRLPLPARPPLSNLLPWSTVPPTSCRPAAD